MAFNIKGVWDRLFHWTHEAYRLQNVSAAKVDKDTDDICANGLSKLLTQSESNGKPVADMDFDGHKIINLLGGGDMTTAVTMRQATGCLFCDDVSMLSDRFAINTDVFAPMPNGSPEDIKLNGMRLFIRASLNKPDLKYLEINSAAGLLLGRFDVKGFDNKYPDFAANDIKALYPYEFVFYRGDVSGTGNDESVFFVKAVKHMADYSLPSLENVTSISSSSALSHYIKASNIAQSTSSVDEYACYTGMIDNDSNMTISCYHPAYSGPSAGKRNFNFTLALGPAFEFDDSEGYSVVIGAESLQEKESYIVERHTNVVRLELSIDGTVGDFQNGVSLLLKGKAKT
ncbi:hypothetical protein AGMMS49543_20680 [Betaproteobacteria bacterium]|nr:hypothetical protein AGMMS49543_20680 [Betaproteobacteria bacterium]